jgi:poly-gamma-glutamate capsule biosynthesis protein CapA/YwtB (metallophosphatase superfamily)
MDPTFVWGDMLPVIRSTDVFAINHESTLAEIPTANPDVIQFEDPINYTHTYNSAGIGFISAANNHFFDFGLLGTQHTLTTLRNMGIPYGGVGNSWEEVQTPTIVHKNGLDIAFFTMMIDEVVNMMNVLVKYQRL